jgi:hypothetical protein
MKANEVKQTLLQNNGKDARLSETKMSHECETSKGKVSSIKDKFKGFIQKKRRERSGVERK